MPARATKADAEKAVRKAFGSRAYAVPQRTLWNAWTVRVVDGAKSPIEDGHQLFVTSDYGHIGLAYGEVVTRCRARDARPTADR